jgi:hypothetical protein
MKFLLVSYKNILSADSSMFLLTGWIEDLTMMTSIQSPKQTWLLSKETFILIKKSIK